MDITIVTPSLFTPGSSPAENAETLRVWLEALVATNLVLLRYHGYPTLSEMIARGGLRYGRTDDWEPISAMYLTGYHGTDKPNCNVLKQWGVFGDCKSLSAARVAELRLRGQVAKPIFRHAELTSRDGRTGLMYHILVQTGITTREDPSKDAGMRGDEMSFMYG